MCENCRELCERFNMSHPYELYSFAKELNKLVKRGILVYTGGNCNLEDIAKNKPWPDDTIEIYFQCSTCKKDFSLFCNTYHGSGCKWLPWK